MRSKMLSFMFGMSFIFCNCDWDESHPIWGADVKIVNPIQNRIYVFTSSLHMESANTRNERRNQKWKCKRKHRYATASASSQVYALYNVREKYAQKRRRNLTGWVNEHLEFFFLNESYGEWTEFVLHVTPSYRNAHKKIIIQHEMWLC